MEFSIDIFRLHFPEQCSILAFSHESSENADVRDTKVAKYIAYLRVTGNWHIYVSLKYFLTFRRKICSQTREYGSGELHSAGNENLAAVELVINITLTRKNSKECTYTTEISHGTS